MIYHNVNSQEIAKLASNLFDTQEVFHRQLKAFRKRLLTIYTGLPDHAPVRALVKLLSSIEEFEKQFSSISFDEFVIDASVRSACIEIDRVSDND